MKSENNNSQRMTNDSLNQYRNISGGLYESIDWNFSIRGKCHPIEGIHPYPAKFISEIPRTLLNTLPIPPQTSVFDPFCGSGTTLIEAQRHGLPSVGIDLNPIACLISRVKTSPLPLNLEREAIMITHVARQNRDPLQWDIPNLDHWFKPEIQEAIFALIQGIRGCESKRTEDVLSLALSSIIVRVSNQESDTRYAAIEKSVIRDDVFEQFLSACVKSKNALEARDWNLQDARVIEGDTLETEPSSIGVPIGMVITSPPYPNAYEYWLYHKYRMWLLGFDPLAVKRQEIGARAHFFKRDHHTEQHFWDQMRRTFILINNVLVNSGFACFVIGRSKIHGRIINNADIIQAISEEQGMSLISRFDRIISAHRKSFNLSHARIKTETVLVFQKG